MRALDAELRGLVAGWARLFAEPEFAHVSAELQRLNDIAFSGDGEPTIVPTFKPALEIAVRVRAELAPPETKIVVITNGCRLARADVADALRVLDGQNGEIWAKLDAGTDEYFQKVNRGRIPLQQVLDNLLAAARTRPIVLQSLFLRLDGEGPPEHEIAAYLERLRWLRNGGAQVSGVQVYTVARRTAEANVAALTVGALEAIAERVRALGLPTQVYG